MPILGGSPLGLVGVESRPNRDGMSNFTGGSSRNVNVNTYNLGKPQQTNVKFPNGKTMNANVSLFTGGSIPKFWPNIKPIGSQFDPTGSSDKYGGVNRKTLHNDEIYDLSLLNIIEKLSFSKKAALRAQDFAYLKKVGVYPNNRLMIARRFTDPQSDNIFGKDGSSPLAVLISWKPEDEDFIEFSFGEEWDDAEADFTNVLNKIGGNFKIGDAGVGLGVGLNAIPLPGVTELMQRKFLQGLGILDNDSNGVFQNTPLPSGNPNLIKEAKRRKTLGYGDSGSGLKGKFTIKMVVEYEQKFISGIDPTIAWMDILNNILAFGTSNSSTYGLNPTFQNNIKRWTGKRGIQELTKDIISILKGAAESIIKAGADFREMVLKMIDSNYGKEEGTNGTSSKENPLLEKIKSGFDSIVSGIMSSINKTIEKYKIELLGITHALSGLPSTPWHITIGNPLRPIFCSGDMLAKDINVKMGPTLAFNDLPSTITVEFTLESARNLGMQEILAKFNSGYLRTVNTRRNAWEENESGNSLYIDSIPNLDDNAEVTKKDKLDVKDSKDVTPNELNKTDDSKKEEI